MRKKKFTIDEIWKIMSRTLNTEESHDHHKGYAHADHPFAVKYHKALWENFKEAHENK